MSGILYEEDSFSVFLLVTVLLGGGAAWLTGQAAAQTWRPVWLVVFYTFLVGAAVRFIHYSLFDGTLLSPHYYLVDTAFCVFIGLAGFRHARTAQMVRQYRWINEGTGPWGWRRKTP
jgi:hypothetical protein